MERRFLLALATCFALGLSGLLAACGGGNDCGVGTVNQDGKCVPQCVNDEYWDGAQCVAVPDCADGTTFNQQTGNCDPACANDEYWDGTQCVAVPDCSPGTHLEGDVCVPDVVCGGGTHPECTQAGDSYNPLTSQCEPSGVPPDCVADYLPDPDVPDDETAVPQFDLPAVGPDNAVSLGGIIETPTDLNDDGIADADWDAFLFQTTTGGIYLRLWATSEDACLPAFVVYGIDTATFGPDPSTWEIFYQRISMNPNGLDSTRELYLPRDGYYLIQVTDYNNLVDETFGTGGIPVGGDEFTYYMTLERLADPAPTALANLPANETGDFTGGKLHFYSMDNIDGQLVKAVSAGQPVPDTASDAFPVLMLFAPDGQLLNEATSYSAAENSEVLFMAATGEYLLVQDFLLVAGSNNQYALDVNPRSYIDCDTTDCSSMDMAAGEENLFLFDLAMYDWFFHSALIPDENYDLAVKVFNLDGGLLAESESYSYYDFWTGQIYLIPSSELIYGYDNMSLIVQVSETTGQAVSYTQDIIDIPESLLVEGPNTGLSPVQFPDMTYYPAGLDQFEASADKLFMFTDYANTNWIQPVTLIMETDQTLISAIDAGGSLVDPPLAVTRYAGRFVHWHMDQGDGAVPGGYDVTMKSMDVAPTIGHLTSNSTIVEATGLTLDATTGYAAFYTTSDEGLAGSVVITPTGQLVPEVMVFAFLNADSQPDPGGNGLGQGLKATGTNPGEALDAGMVLAPYSGDYLVLVRDVSGNAAPADTFDIIITYVPPPANDTCETAEPITLDGSGHASIQATTAVATNVVDLDGGSCTGYSTNGAELFYSIDLVAGQTITVTQTPDAGATTDSALYMITDCADPTGSCVVGADDTMSGGIEQFTYDVTADDSYIIVPDAYSGGGGFTLDVTVQ